MTNLDGASCDVFVEEETSGDSETDHTDEVVGYFAIMTPHTLTLEIEDHCEPTEDPIDYCEDQYLFNCDDLLMMTE